MKQLVAVPGGHLLTGVVMALVLAVRGASAGATEYSVMHYENPGLGDEFAHDVQIIGDLVAAGDPHGGPDGEDGTVAIFSRTTGVLLRVLHDPSSSDENYFGGALANVAGKLAVGASDDNAVYLFDPVTGQLQRTFNGPVPDSAFGQAVAAMGSDVLISSLGGSVYRFDSATGALLMTYPNPGLPSNSFGISVAAVGANLIVGAFADSSDAPFCGIAFLIDGTTGALLQTLHSPAPETRQAFGWRVGALGNDALVAAPAYTTLGGSGLGHVYQFDSGGTLVHTFTDPAPANLGSFGFAFASYAGDVFIGSAIGHNDAVYRFDGASGMLEETILPWNLPGNLFGIGLDVEQGSVLIADGDSMWLFDPCGNGLIAGAGEQCDDGNQVSGDGCSQSCRLELCPSVPAPGCHQPGGAAQSSIQIKKSSTGKLVWKWKGTGAVGDFGDPEGTDDYVLCLYDAHGGVQPLRTFGAPAGARWRAKGGSGFFYASPAARADGILFQNPTALPDGIVRVKLRASAGRVHIAAKGTGDLLDGLAMPFVPSLRVQLHRSGAPGTCWEAAFTSDIHTSSDRRFSARSDP